MRWFPALLLLASCGPAVQSDGGSDGSADAAVASIDAGLPDAGELDGGPVDAGAPDAGLGDAGSVDAGPLDAGALDAGPLDAGPLDAGPLDAGPLDAGSLDAGGVDAGSPDAGGVDAGATPLTLSPSYLGAGATTERGLSVWATESYPPGLPLNRRSTVFWGRFLAGGCSVPWYGDAVEHSASIPGVVVLHAFFPDCAGSSGPAVEADVLVNGQRRHLLRSEVAPTGAFQTFGPSGQNATGANRYIQALITEFSPGWYPSIPDRLRPWGGASTHPDQIRMAFRVRESVTADRLDAPQAQQLQQVMRFLVLNEDCNRSTSSTYCQLEFNFKTYNRGLNAYTTFTSGDAFNDNGQGGLIAIVGPIAATGVSTRVKGQPAWTSWASETQLAPFQDRLFQIEISWNQFQTLLRNVSLNGDPTPLFGSSWQDRQKWVLLSVGYGQENYNASSTGTSVVEGLFEYLEVFAL